MSNSPRNLAQCSRPALPFDIGIFAAGAAIGWFLASQSRSMRRVSQAAPAPSPSPRAATPGLSLWKNGARWMTALNIVADTPTEITVGATLEDIRSLQRKTQASSQEAHGKAFIHFSATQDVRYSKQAVEINDKDDQFNQALKDKVESLLGSDISRLNDKSSDLEKAAKEIPDAGDAIGKIDSFLNVFNDLIGLV